MGDEVNEKCWISQDCISRLLFSPWIVAPGRIQGHIFPFSKLNTSMAFTRISNPKKKRTAKDVNGNAKGNVARSHNESVKIISSTQIAKKS